MSTGQYSQQPGFCVRAQMKVPLEVPDGNTSGLNIMGHQRDGAAQVLYAAELRVVQQ